jgi:hypothetical protein
MSKQLLLIIHLLVSFYTFSQVTGTINSSKNNPLPFVNIYIENTFIGTTSNEDGFYELDYNKTGEVTIVFKYLGYKTLKKKVTINAFPFELNANLVEENITLSEVVINAEENPANQIIRNAIAYRKQVLEKLKTYKADFYSRGLIRIKDAPKKFMGQEVGDLGGGLDSTRSGIIYLSETISKLEYLKPKKLKEKIIASKVSGNDNGFSFNNASDVNFNFYYNTVELGSQIVSPISDFAFNYYRYKLEGVFYDDIGNLINKIKIIPKRKNDKAFSGYVYIVEDQWTFYAVDVTITGQQTQITPVDLFTLKQSFKYSKKDKLWALISQTFDFKYGLFGIKGDGRFTAVYSNYDFNPEFSKRAFTREILAFEKNANKKDSVFWKTVRPVPLTIAEITDYTKKDSIQIVKKSKKYLDSIDKVNNHFKILDLITGYSYQNSHKDWDFSFSGPLRAMSFNTVQGPNARMDFNFRKKYDEFKRYFNAKVAINYSIEDKLFRPTINLTYKFNNVSRPILTLSGGSKVAQFNPNEPISITVNSIASLFFEDNYMKLYSNSFVQASYSQELFNGFRFYTTLSYENRKPLFNSSTNLFVDDPADYYISNNPLDENAFGIAPFKEHNLMKFFVSARINFAQDYLSYPDSKFNISNGKFPTLFLTYEKGFTANNTNYNFDQIRARLTQSIDISNKGEFKYNLKAGTFFNANNIAFMDFQHFNGNQTHVGTTSNYLNAFNNLPYYAFSTNKSYLEFHTEHDFKGYILGKIPLLNKLNYNLVIGAHTLATESIKPYQEFSIGIDNLGWGKFRLLRFDYVRSYQNGYKGDALIFGLKFFGFIN